MSCTETKYSRRSYVYELLPLRPSIPEDHMCMSCYYEDKYSRGSMCMSCTETKYSRRSYVYELLLLRPSIPEVPCEGAVTTETKYSRGPHVYELLL